MNIQTETAMRIFTDIYGMPNWEKNVKEGQSPSEIIKLWDDELSGYTEQQVKNACYKLAKFRKVMTFPTISHLMSELCDEDKDVKTDNQVQFVLKALLNNKELSELAIQRTMWNLYKYSYNGYKAEEK